MHKIGGVRNHFGSQLGGINSYCQLTIPGDDWQRSECQLYASEMLEEASFMELELFREDLYLTGKLLVLQVALVLFQNVGDLKLSFGCCHVYLAVIRTEFAPRGCLCYHVLVTVC